MTRVATCGFFEKGPEGSHGNARLTKLRSERGKENARIKFFPSAVSRTCFIIRYDAFQKNSPANRDLSTNLDIWILLFSSFSLTIAEFNENRGCFFMCLFLRFLQRYEEKPPPGQFFQSTVLILGHFLFFPVNSLINSLFSRENKIALLYAAVTTQRVSWACVPIHFSHISAQVKLQQITVCGVTGIINDNACVYNHFVRKKERLKMNAKLSKMDGLLFFHNASHCTRNKIPPGFIGFHQFLTHSSLVTFNPAASRVTFKIKNATTIPKILCFAWRRGAERAKHRDMTRKEIQITFGCRGSWGPDQFLL